MKRMISALLCALMLLTSAVPAWAENTATPSEPTETKESISVSATASGDTVTVTVSGGAGKTMTATLGGMSADASSGTAVFTGVAAGTHTVTVSGEGVETATCTVTVEAPAPEKITVSATASGDTVTVTVSGGAGKTMTATLGGASAAVNNGVAVFTGVAAGTHTVTVSGEGVETATCTVTVEAPAPEKITASASVNGSTVTVTVTGGEGRTLTAQLGSAVVNVTGGVAVFENVAAGDHTITILENGASVATCTATVAAQTPKPAPVTASASVNGSTVTVTVTGREGRTLTAQLGSAVVNVTGGVAVFENVAAGDHTITILENGASVATCTATVAAATPKPAPVTASASVSGDTVKVTVTGGEGRTLTAVLGSASVNVSGGVAVFTGVAAGSHTINIMEGGAVVASCTADVAEKPKLQVAALTSEPAASGMSSGTITGKATLSGAQVAVRLLDSKGKEIKTLTLGADGAFEFAGLAAGEYTVNFYNAADMSAVLASYPQTVGESAPTAIGIAATATTGFNRIDVNVTTASALPVAVTLEMLDGAVVARKTIAGGVGNVAFTDVKAGTYNVRVAYEQNVGVAATMIGGLAVTDAPKGITIASVTGGEGKLVVTGTAQPDVNITLTTIPASATTVVRSDKNGSFTANLICAAGTYTEVKAQYDGGEGAVSKKGTFEVTGTAVKPTLTVDRIDVNSHTVVAKTTPGVRVLLTTPDFTNTQNADADGIVRFTLPHTYLKGQQFALTVYYGAGNALSFSQNVTVEDAGWYNLLKKGSYGADVLRLTERLNALGYPIAATKSYNEGVRNAVKLFQARAGLSVDGMAGELTQGVLYSVSAPKYGETAEYPTLVRGDRGMALIYTLQQRLKDLGYYTIRVDGIYGSGTQRAVRQFQSVNGLTVTGIADSATQKLLHSSSAKANNGITITGSYQTLRRSSRYNAAVVTMQRRLKNLGYLNGAVDGYFGSITQRAVRSFQRRNGLSVTGVADPYTQEVLYSSSALAAASGSSSGTSTSTGYKLLYWGCTGSAVKRLQNALIDAGYKSVVRTADGIYGKWTYDAVRAYQKDHGLAVDGIAGKNTQNSLYGTSY